VKAQMRMWSVLATVGAAVAWTPAAASPTTSAEILAASADLDCLEYRATGACVWLACGPVGCSTSTSVKYRHFVPEAVVTAYGSVAAHPWAELGRLLSVSGGLDGGTPAKGGGSRGSTAYRFKLAEVVGSPGLAWLDALDLPTTVCEAQSTALRPYFVSTTDPVWRLDVAQVPWTVLNILRRVKEPGLGGRLWGPVYPRSGAVQQGDDYRAAAVVAQRAADVVTRRRQWQHVYSALAGRNRTGQWGPPPVREGAQGNHKWQPLVPEIGSCAIFGDGEEPTGQSEAGAYAWNLWRPYECCARRGQVLVAHW